ncbi:O-antigen ligase [Desulfobaculum xiamenense]|uniref:O-antigen ligase n=1 Tax=Desulfobaculum xiamenense TaxID=995050 RepID=A0A846QFS6_9BACT|nr:O-antigen ligase family protein [Desulfobaculum xiamenense]NJB67646.1 O-antigen ligase [Desulfobaculum xiamenense]
MTRAQPTPINPVFAITAGGVVAATIAALASPTPALALLPGLAVLMLLALAKRPHWGYYAIIWLIPFGAYRELPGPLGFVKIHWLLAFCLIAFVILRALAQRRLPDATHARLWGPFTLLMVISAISAALSPYPHLSWRNVALFVVAAMYMGLTMVHVDRTGYVRVLPQVLLWSVTVGSCLAALGFFFDIPLFAEKVGGDFKRGLGTAPDPNNMALMIIFTMPFLAHWFFTTRRKLVRVLVPGLMGVNALGMVTTYSRGGALLMALTIVAIAIQHRENFAPRHVGLALAGLAIATATTLTIVPASYWERQQSLVTAEDLSIKRRASYLIVAWDAFRQRPLTGWGPGTFRQLYAESPQAQQYVRPGRSKLRPAHNTYVEMLVGTGLIGMAVYLHILARTMLDLRRARRLFAASGDTQAARITSTYIVSFGALLLFLLMFSDEYHKYLLLALALSQVAKRFAQEREESP